MLQVRFALIWRGEGSLPDVAALVPKNAGRPCHGSPVSLHSHVPPPRPGAQGLVQHAHGSLRRTLTNRLVNSSTRYCPCEAHRQAQLGSGVVLQHQLGCEVLLLGRLDQERGERQTVELVLSCPRWSSGEALCCTVVSFVDLGLFAILTLS